MSKRYVSDIATNAIRDLGRAAAHYLYPNEIDFYFISFELVDSENRTVDFFAFPVSPKSIIFQDKEATRIQRTFGGVSVLKTSTFDPKSITLQGDFGRNFKFILGGETFSFAGFNVNMDNGITVDKFKLRQNELSSQIKSGYGCIKVLERIIKRAKSLDENSNPYKLYFYNTSLNQQFLIEPQDLNFSQNMSQNMIWNYTLRFEAVANLEELGLINEMDLANNLAVGVLNKAANNIANHITRILL